MHPLPRPTRFVRLALLVAGGALAYLAWTWANGRVIAYLSGVAAPFCMLCAGAVWALRDKAEDRLVRDTSDSAELSRALEVVADLRRRFAPRAAWVATLALVAGSPATSWQLSGVIWQWSVYAAGFAIAEAAYGYLLATAWDEQLRAERARRAVQALRDAEQVELLRRLRPIEDDQPIKCAFH